MNQTTNTLCPRIYVACLAAYNQGTLHGEWIDTNQGADCIHEEIQAMLSKSPAPGAEEWAIHDYEDFGGLGLSEFEDIDRVAELGQLVAEHGAAFGAYANHVGVDYASAEGFQEAYCGEWDSEEAYAEELFDELYAHDIPENLRFYIDYEKFARDLFINDCYAVDCPDGGVFVFHRC
ncbi:MAG: antirestriction protein ArdA [Planctomycetota bacterium]|jgi:antirestriction protein